MLPLLNHDRLERGYEIAREALLAERNRAGHWVGELSTSPLSTATAVVALELVRRGGAGNADQLSGLIAGGLEFLAASQNQDGGWGDTLKSISNISTSMLAHAAFHATATTERYAVSVQASARYIDRIGGIRAVRERYGKDQTFSVPILTCCALAGLVDWREVAPLPFELACLPSRFYSAVNLPVVSYALPALIAIGQARFHHGRTLNPLTRCLRTVSRGPSLKVLERIQPTSGGFLEAAPLTSFVTMSLASMGLVDHPVTRKGVDFLIESVRADGSWPIDTNLATWVTTLSVNALDDDLPRADRGPILDWLLEQQYKTVHPYTNADPGGWAWTDLTGGVPDADDTPGALLALRQLLPGPQSLIASTASATLSGSVDATPPIARDVAASAEGVRVAAANGVRWLLDLQNRDGGWPTFCRGWGYLPFDKSASDLTAHALRALDAWRDALAADRTMSRRMEQASARGLEYLRKTQRPDGSWLPLWFGNQFAHNDENPTYGTARVLAAFRDLGRCDDPAARRGLCWLVRTRNMDGGWGGAQGVDSSVEETALATEILLAVSDCRDVSLNGVNWLLQKVESGEWTETTPIGFYFAKLWYFERLYPIIFTVAALRHACRRLLPDQARVRQTV